MRGRTSGLGHYLRPVFAWTHLLHLEVHEHPLRRPAAWGAVIVRGKTDEPANFGEVYEAGPRNEVVARLEKEKQHYQNALNALRAKGDEEGALRIAHQLEDVNKAIQDVDYRAANIRAGYVYVISNIGSFGESMVKIGMTRRLEPMDRINELGDASVPFRFDVHALFFSKDAVTIETEMHKRLSEKRVNRINTRREFFNCSPAEAKAHLSELAGELLEFTDAPEALEWRQSAQHNSQPGEAREEVFAPTK